MAIVVIKTLQQLANQLTGDRSRNDANRRQSQRERFGVFIYPPKRGVIIRKCQLQIELCLVTRILYCIHHIYTVCKKCIG